MMRSFLCVARAGLLAGSAAALAGCAWFGGGDGGTHKAASAFAGTDDTTDTVDLGNGYGLNLPTNVGGFARTDVRVGAKATEATGTYAQTAPPGPIAATVHVQQASGGGSIIPFTGGGGDVATGERSDAALSALIAQVVREHPDAAVSGRENVFLLRFGVLQAGRAATLTATDTLGDRRQPVTVLIETFCCVGGKWDYQYRFEAPAGANVRELENVFARAIPWSREASGSVEQPE